MKRLLVTIAVLIGLAMGCRSGDTGKVRSPLSAETMGERDNDKFSFGKVVGVRRNQLIVKEYDFAKDADCEVIYTVTPETELGNINKVEDLQPGDDIVMDYVEKQDRRVISTLVKEEAVSDAPTIPVAGVPARNTASGKVVSLTPGKLTIRQFSSDNQTTELVGYAILRRAKMKGVNSLSDLKQGDNVTLEYIIKTGRRMIIVLER